MCFQSVQAVLIAPGVRLHCRRVVTAEGGNDISGGEKGEGHRGTYQTDCQTCVGH